MTSILLAVLLAAEGFIAVPPVVQTVKAPEPAVIEHRLTAYSCFDEACVTASGAKGGPGMVGVPLEGPAAYPLGTILEIEGIGPVVVADRCPGCEGYWLDVWQPSREAEIQFGSQYRAVRVLQE